MVMSIARYWMLKRSTTGKARHHYLHRILRSILAANAAFRSLAVASSLAQVQPRVSQAASLHFAIRINA